MQKDNAKTGWFYRDQLPPNDNAYFENMSRIILKGSLNWQFIEDRWKASRKAFENFDIDIVSDFDPEDIDMLMSNKGIIKSRSRIEAIIVNAMIFQGIRKEYGSFRNYLDQLDITDNYSLAIKELVRKFEKLSESIAAIFLYSVGENIVL